MSKNSTSVTVYVKMQILLQVEGSLNHLFLIDCIYLSKQLIQPRSQGLVGN